MTKEGKFFLTGKVKKFEGKQAVVETGDGQIINWPIKDLSEDVDVGSDVSLNLNTNTNMAEDQNQIAKKILNEILNQSE